MPEITVSIARVPLARAPRRLIGVPLIAIAVGGGALLAGAVLGSLPGVGLALAGLATGVLGAWLGLILLSIRLDVEVSAIRLHWMGGERRYALVRGAVTRIALDGPKAVPVRAWFGAFGWTVGRARLRGEERIEIVRLAPTASLILVPTEGTRLAVAPRSEQDLIEALRAAARVQQRLDAARPRVRLPVAPTSVEVAPAPAAAAEFADPAWPHVLTGIERVELEARLAAQRAAALAAAEAERARAADLAAAPTTLPAVPSATTLPARRRIPSLRRPAWTRPSRGVFRLLGVLLVPTAGAALVWAFVAVTGPAALAPAQHLGLALLLTGPAASLGAAGARIWWPKLMPLVIGSALFALALLATGMALPA